MASQPRDKRRISSFVNSCRPWITKNQPLGSAPPQSRVSRYSLPTFLRACLENGLLVAQATRLCRQATCRTERERQFEPMDRAFSLRCPRQFRSAGRRPGRAGRPSTLRSKQALAPVASERATEDGRQPFSNQALRTISDGIARTNERKARLASTAAANGSNPPRPRPNASWGGLN